MTDSKCSACGKRIPDMFDKRCECGVWFADVKPIRDDPDAAEREAYQTWLNTLPEKARPAFLKMLVADAGESIWLARAKQDAPKLTRQRYDIAMDLLERAVNEGLIQHTPGCSRQYGSEYREKCDYEEWHADYAELKGATCPTELQS